ncbi:class I SAM-dependent methyltransferase [Enterobacter asburiae]
MNYIINGTVIRSENAAKPHTMPSNYLCNHLKVMKKKGIALDFGCGKLRYSEQLVEKFDSVTFLDSRKQIERNQMIRGIKTSVINYVSSHYKKASVVPFEEVQSIDNKYDFVLCSNVLSAIPCRMTIDKVLSSIKSLLKHDGEALIVNQYKSSYFKRYESGIKHLYGYIYRNSSSSSYYGLLDESSVRSICQDNGLSIVKSWSREGSSYVIVRVEDNN